MKKTKFAAALLIAVLGLGTAAVPCGTFDTAITASAETALSAPKGIKTACGEGELTVTWDKVSGASAYKISTKYSYDKNFKTLKTVYSTSASIPYLLNGDEITVKITPLKRAGNGFKEGTSVKFTKKFKGAKAFIKDDVFIFDTSLLGKTSSQVATALGRKLTLQKWEWWTDVDGNPVKIAFVSFTKDDGMALVFDKDKKLIQAFADLPYDRYSEAFNTEVKRYYGNGRDIMDFIDKSDKDKGRKLFYDRYWIRPNGTVYDVSTELYLGEDRLMLRQDYFIYDRLIKD